MTSHVKWTTTLSKVLKKNAVWIFPAGLLYSYFDQKITQGMFEQMISMEGLDARIWLYASAAIALGLIYPVLILNLLVASLLPQKNSWSQALREQMRATGSSLLWGLLFVIPGFIRYFQLLFVPMVTLAHPQYQSGDLDALKTSRKLVHQHWLKLLFLTFLFALVLPLMLSGFDEQKLFSENLVSAVLLSMLETLLSLVFLSVLWSFFAKSVLLQEKNL
jgi:hypothetical protein